VEEKLIDQVGGLHDAMEKLYSMIAENKADQAKDGQKAPKAKRSKKDKERLSD